MTSLASSSEAGCFHCGLAVPGRAFVGVVQNSERSFCCAGCLAIARTIHEAGLHSFYAARTSASPKAGDGGSAGEWILHDSETLAQGLVRDLGADRCEASLLLEGLSCGACVWLVEAWLARQPGIELARVNFATRRALVVWHRRETRLAAVLQAIAAIGYRAHPYDPARREAVARRERRSLLARMAVALLAMMQVMMFAVPTYVSADGVAPEAQRLLDWAGFVLSLPVLFYSAAPIFRSALRDVRLRAPGMDVPVALGLGAAFAASAWSTLGRGGPVYYDSVTMFVALLLVARYVELVARQRAGEAIEAASPEAPALAERIARWPDDRTTAMAGAAALSPGDHVLVRAGGTVPADGEIVEGRSHVEEGLLTGESRPRAKAPGDGVLAGAVNCEGPLVVRVVAAGESTQRSALIRLAERASSERPRVARIADRAAAWFVGALLVLVIGTAFAWWQIDPARVVPVTFALLVVSCPCALSLATPSVLASAAGALSRRQVVLTRPDAIEALARVTHVVFDKTGTLTMGNVALQSTCVLDGSGNAQALARAAALEAASEHPIGRALAAATPGAAPPAVEPVSIPGRGMEGTIEGIRYRIGSAAFVHEIAGAMPVEGVAFIDAVLPTATVVVLGSAKGTCAVFALGDSLRRGAREAVDAVRANGLTPVLMSGDRLCAARALGSAPRIDDVRGDLSPADKLAAIRALQARGAVVAMVGDGVNDAPGLAQADVSVSLGSATRIAQCNADVVVLSDELPRIAEAIGHAERTLAIIRQNLGWAFAYNGIAIPAAAFGLVTPLVAAAGMSLSSLAVVLNALRAARVVDAPRPAVLSPRPCTRTSG